MKRISRQELKQEIKDLKSKLRIKEAELHGCEEDYTALKNRFMSIANYTEEILNEDTPIKTVSVDVKTYGQYARLAYGEELDEETMEMIIRELAISIARGLVEQSMAKICVSDDDPFGRTIATKLYVIPWEQMNRIARGKITLQIEEGLHDDRPSD